MARSVAKAKRTKKVEVVTAKPKKTRAKRLTEKLEPHPLERLIGGLVRYYDEGWRHGYLEKVVKGKTASIRPITAYKATYQPRNANVPLEDMKEVTHGLTR